MAGGTAVDEEFVEPRPCVINEKLLQRGAYDGLTDDEQRHMADNELHGEQSNVLSPPEVHSLSLSYMHIRKISNLQVYTALRELNLSNNLITKIEGLQTLVTLQKLDLSFNEISEFGGLEFLAELEELSLFKNRVQSLEGFPILPKLRLLSLGRNKIADLQEIAHLYKLKTLRVLTLVDNPIQAKDVFKLTVLAYLPGLRFLDYARVAQSDITDAKERHSDQLNALQQTDLLDRQAAENKRTEEAQQRLLHDAYLNKIADLQQSIFKRDNDHAKLRTIGDLAQPFMRFTDELRKVVESFVADMKIQYKMLLDEQEQYQGAHAVLIEENRLAQVKVVKQIERQRRAFMESVSADDEEDPEAAHDDEAKTKAFLAELEAVKDKLLTEEFVLVDVIQEMIRLYEMELFDERLAVVNERISAFFNIVRTLENDYSERVTDLCMKLWERFNQGEALEVTDEIRAILVDKDTLLATIAQSHEHRTTKLYRRQEDVTQLYKGRVERMSAEARLTDLERNRARITEIANYVQNIMNAIAQMQGEDIE